MRGILQSCPDLLPIVEVCVYHKSSDRGEGQSVRKRVAHGNVHGRVGFVFGQNEVLVLIDDFGDIVCRAGIVVGVT